MNNSELPINKLIAKMNTAADNDEPMSLSVDEVKLMAKNFGNLVMIPVYDMNNFPVDKYKRNKAVDSTKK